MPDFDTLATLHSRVRETPDTWTVNLLVPKGFRYRPGQFAMVKIGSTGAVRCWTLSSTPGFTPFVSFTVRRVEGGVGSPWITRGLPEGSVIEMTQGMGDFVADEKDPGPFLFVMSGSGITPAASIIRDLLMRRANARVTLVYCVADQASLVFGNFWRMLEECRPNEFRFIPFVKADPRPGDQTGRLTAERLLALVPDAADHSVFACGSAGFMNMAEGWCRTLGVAPERFKKEAFLP